MKVIILPGLDGTDTMVGAFGAALPPEFDVVAWRYPDEMTNYEALTEWAAARLPDDDYVIIAQSFSGPVAIRLAVRQPKGLRAVVFVATFAQTPRNIPRFMLALLSALPLTSRLFGWAAQPIVMGRWASRGFTAAFCDVLGRVPKKTMLGRIAALRDLNMARDIDDIAVPALYLQASHDGLVPSRAAQPFPEVQFINGPHFLLQANPGDAADAIARFIAGEV